MVTVFLYIIILFLRFKFNSQVKHNLQYTRVQTNELSFQVTAAYGSDVKFQFLSIK